MCTYKKIKELLKNRKINKLEERVDELKSCIDGQHEMYSSWNHITIEYIAKLERILKYFKDGVPTFYYGEVSSKRHYPFNFKSFIDLYLYINREEYPIRLESVNDALIVRGTERLTVDKNIATFWFEYKTSGDEDAPRVIKTYQIDYKKGTYICSESKA